MLVLGDNDALGLLEQSLVVPARVQVGELTGHSVVLAKPDRVHRREEVVVFGARVTGLEELACAHT